MRKKNCVYCFIFLISILILTSPVLASHGVADDKKVIRVVMDDNYPPYAFRDDSGKLQGITIDQWQLFEQKTGIVVNITGMSWNNAYQSMLEGKFDVVDTISYNEGRDKILDYSEPYATIDVPIFFHKNISGITDVNSLKGFAVGAKRGDNAINELMKKGITNIKAYESAEAVIRAARNQEIVIFVMGKPPSLYHMYKMGIHNEFNYVSSLYTSQFFRAVKQGDKSLLNTLNKGFSSISKAEYKKIQDKWYGKTTQPIYETELFRSAIITLVIILAVILFLLAWNRTLHLRVRQKTKALSRTIDELQTSEARAKAILEAIPDLFFMFDKSGRIMDYHAVQESELYMPPEQFLGKSVADIFPAELSQVMLAAIGKAIESKKIQTIEYNLSIHHNPSDFEARLASCGSDRVVGIVRDITERKKSEERLVDISIHDSLTGLFNRYYFENEVARLKGEVMHSLCIMMFDLDGLKLINDTLGHSVGDQYLVAASKIIVDAFPKDSMISRIGGDEFCVIVSDRTNKEIQTCISRFNEGLNNINKESHIIQMSISYGYVFAEGESLDIHEMLKEADNRMYRVKLHRRRSMKSEVVQAMKKMLEERDFITEGHATRMEELAVGLSRVIGIQEKDIDDMRLLAQFHDIGKVGIPDYILTKPAALTKEEFEMMKRHTEIGHRIAESSVDLLPIADYILKHHEHWDGSGYPFGLRGNEIPVECRILTIVDAYDAMTNDRPYRKALSKEAALEELKRCAGTQFDPILTGEFLKMMKKF